MEVPHWKNCQKNFADCVMGKFEFLRASCTNVVHDLGSAEPRSRVEPSSR